MAFDDATDLGDSECIQQTERAVLCLTEAGDEVWIPKTCLHDDSEVYEKGHKGKLIVKAWWAAREGLA